MPSSRSPLRSDVLGGATVQPRLLDIDFTRIGYRKWQVRERENRRVVCWSWRERRLLAEAPPAVLAPLFRIAVTYFGVSFFSEAREGRHLLPLSGPLVLSNPIVKRLELLRIQDVADLISPVAMKGVELG
ncbi:MAG: hypothetical protein ACRD3O_00725, partial [Terriglobia bacterium]